MANPVTVSLIESFEGFISHAKWDVNAYRVGFGSDTVTLPNGSVQKVLPTTVVSRQDAERDLSRRLDTEFVPRAASQVGQAQWQKFSVRTQAALVSLTYNYGSLPQVVLNAARSGKLTSIKVAILSLKGQNNGVNDHRRQQEADYVI